MNNYGSNNHLGSDKKLPIGYIYVRLRLHIMKRNECIKKQKELWKVINRRKRDKSYKMSVISKEIGEYTNLINNDIAELTKHRKTHKAMRLAYEYLDKEINRINKIIKYNSSAIYKVDNGYDYLIDSTGNNHKDTHELKRYVSHKKEQVAKLISWRNSISRYIY